MPEVGAELGPRQAVVLANPPVEVGGDDDIEHRYDANTRGNATCVEGVPLVMRVLVVLGVVVGCTKATPDEPPRPVPVDAGVVDRLIGPRPIVVDATPVDADLADKPIDVPVLAMAGPYPSLAASCATTMPCIVLALDDQGNELPTPATPDCTAVLDPSKDATSEVPRALKLATAGGLHRVHAIPGGELRIAGVRCEVPKGERGESSKHYVFVQRSDGWWRTQAPVFEHNYNERYCNGGMYLRWNTKAARTIVGLAGSHTCMSCNKQMTSEAVTELMLRIEPGGVKPRVFAPLVVGLRSNTEDSFGVASPSSDLDCKVGATATSLQETWLADDEVVLAGPAVAVGGPLTTTFTIGYADVTQLARPGRYRFPRP